MNKTTFLKKLDEPSIRVLKEIAEKRISKKNPLLTEKVGNIIKEVREGGDRKIREYTKRFDLVDVNDPKIPPGIIRSSGSKIDSGLKRAISVATANIKKFHIYTQPRDSDPINTINGIECFLKYIPVDRVGLYIPGGTSPLFSTLLMTAIPAKIAGCREIAIFTPPKKDTKLPDPVVLYCADLLGINELYTIGGVQAIAAMAFGTGSIKKVNKIFGPGNMWVNEAKLQVAGAGVAIDMPAGPSELMIISDESAKRDLITADFMSQLEHGPDSIAILISDSMTVLDEVEKRINESIKGTSFDRVISANLKNCYLIKISDKKKCEDFINNFAPEHLMISSVNSKEWITKIRNAGSVFLGELSSESAGDYATGPNHTLPTRGGAIAFSGLTVMSFKKSVTFQSINRTGLENIGDAVVRMAESEGLKYHAESVKVRLSGKKKRCREEVLSNPPGVKKRFRQIPAFTCARTENRSGKIFLDANESPFEVFKNSRISKYPDPLQKDLKRVIAKDLQLPGEMIALGNGSDELIDILIRAFCRESVDNILICPPTYGMYSRYARLNGVPVKEVHLLPGFILDTKGVLKKTRKFPIKIIFINSPNNPTANIFPAEEILRLAADSGAITVVDEAYIDFSDSKSLISRLMEYPNLVILRTLSKSFSAAGLRIGILAARREIAGIVDRIRSPYNISGPSQELGIELIKRKKEISTNIKKIKKNREYLRSELLKYEIVIEVFHSESNFILARFRDSKRVLNRLKEEGIIVRDRSMLPLCNNCLRITVGSEKDNSILLQALRSMSKKRGTK